MSRSQPDPISPISSQSCRRLSDAAVIDAECAFGLARGPREVTGLLLTNQLDHTDKESICLSVCLSLSLFFFWQERDLVDPL